MGTMPTLCGDDELRSVIEALGPEEALGNFKLAELKTMCKRFHLKSTGDKHQLICFIARHILAASSDGKIASSKGQKRTLEVQEANRTAAKRPCTDLEKHLQGIVQALGPEEALGNLTVPKLREHCRCFGLRITGDKRNIISRIATHLLALELQTEVHTDSTSAPAQGDQCLPSQALGSVVGVAASRPGAAEALTHKAPLDAAFAAVEVDGASVPGMFAMSEPETPVKTAAPKGETTQDLNHQNLAQKAATIEAEIAADISNTCGQTTQEASTSSSAMQTVHEHQLHSSGADPAGHVHIREEADEIFVGDLGNNCSADSEQPNSCEEAVDINAVEIDRVCSAESEAATISAAPTIPMDVDGEAVGMQGTMHDRQENAGSAKTLLEEEGEDAYNKQEQQEQELKDKQQEITQSEACVTDQTSSIACELEDTSQTTVQALVVDRTMNYAIGNQGDDVMSGGTPSVCEEVSENDVVQSEQAPCADSHAVSIPAASTAFIEDQGGRGEESTLVSADMQAMDFSTNHEHPESAEIEEEDGGDERREDRQVEDEQREEMEDGSWDVKEEEVRHIRGHSEQQRENDEVQETVADSEDISQASQGSVLEPPWKFD